MMKILLNFVLFWQASLDPFVADQTVAGYAWLVQRDGKTVSEGSGGYLDLEKQIPMRRDAIFQVMSMTKPFTAAGVMKLVEEGKVGLDDAVSKHLPEFADVWVLDAAASNAGEQRLVKPKRPVTVRDLMTHTGGLVEYGPAFLKTYQTFGHTLREAVAVESRQPLKCSPGECFQYSNPGIAALGRIIEVARGKKYEDVIAEEFFGPLGLRDTSFFAPMKKRERIAMVYRAQGGKLLGYGEQTYRKGAVYPCPECGIFSTAADMAVWHAMFANGGVHEGKRILKEETVAEMSRNQTAELNSPAGAKIPARGLGWAFYENGWVGHGGAFGTMGMFDPKTKTVAVLMVQRLGGYEKVQKAFRDMVMAEKP
jgi:CubicO group peptidase (beta-lactamase class C family)